MKSAKQVSSEVEQPTPPPIFHMSTDGACDASAALMMSISGRDKTSAGAQTYLALLPLDVRAHVDRLVRAVAWLDTGVLRDVESVGLRSDAVISKCAVLRSGEYVCVLSQGHGSQAEVRHPGRRVLCACVCEVECVYGVGWCAHHTLEAYVRTI